MESCVAHILHLKLNTAETGALCHVFEQYLQTHNEIAQARWHKTMGRISRTLMRAADEYQEVEIEIRAEQAQFLRHLFAEEANWPQEQARLLDDLRREVDSCWFMEKREVQFFKTAS